MTRVWRDTNIRMTRLTYDNLSDLEDLDFDDLVHEEVTFVVSASVTSVVFQTSI